MKIKGYNAFKDLSQCVVHSTQKVDTVVVIVIIIIIIIITTYSKMVVLSYGLQQARW